MPELRVGALRWQVPHGASLLDALNHNGVAVPFSCRAGHCHACRVRCVAGDPQDERPDALPASERAAGWRLACQCRVQGDLAVVPYDPRVEGIEAHVAGLQWPSAGVLRLRLLPAQPVRYQAGQHAVLWAGSGVARPYSFASPPGEAPWLEFHIDCTRPGAFVDRARQLQPGDTVRVGEVLGGPLHYDPAWEARPLWLLASGTGLAPLWAVLREALRQQHRGEIRVMHWAKEGEHYLAQEIQALAGADVHIELLGPGMDLSTLRPPRQAIALACGAPATIDALGRRLFMAGLPRNQVLTEPFEHRIASPL